MTKKHCMIDLETLDILPTAAILSIGAVIFKLDGSPLTERFYVNVDPGDAKAQGCTISKDTVKWWSEQPKEIMEAFKTPKPIGLKSALEQLFDFYKKTGSQMVWSHGASFDLPIISYAARRVQLKEPWEYWQQMCNRTVLAMIDSPLPKKRESPHNALDDAKTQAEHIMSLFNK